MKKPNDLYVLMFRDRDCYGCTQPMSKLEADVMTKEALAAGYDVCAVELTKLFESKKYILNTIYTDWKEGDVSLV